MVSDFSESSSLTYLQIKKKAEAVERLYAENDIPLSPACDLARLIADAKLLSDSWLLNRAENYSWELLFRVLYFDRIADAILPLESVPSCAEYLAALVSGNLKLLGRKRSKAKDVLWELELWAILRRSSFDAVLSEPPDIVVEFEGAKIGIACKKLYSERHVQNVVSEAVAQIEDTFDFGIVAVSLDDLVPENNILQAPTEDKMKQKLIALNTDFLHKHERHFRRYLAPGRLIAALVSTSVLADIHHDRPSLKHARQSTIWTIPGLPPDKDMQLRRFHDQLMG